MQRSFGLFFVIALWGVFLGGCSHHGQQPEDVQVYATAIDSRYNDANKDWDEERLGLVIVRPYLDTLVRDDLMRVEGFGPEVGEAYWASNETGPLGSGEMAEWEIERPDRRYLFIASEDFKHLEESNELPGGEIRYKPDWSEIQEKYPQVDRVIYVTPIGYDAEMERALCHGVFLSYPNEYSPSPLYLFLEKHDGEWKMVDVTL